MSSSLPDSMSEDKSGPGSFHMISSEGRPLEPPPPQSDPHSEAGGPFHSEMPPPNSDPSACYYTMSSSPQTASEAHNFSHTGPPARSNSPPKYTSSSSSGADHMAGSTDPQKYISPTSSTAVVGNPTTAASVVGAATTACGLFGYDPAAHYRQAQDAAMYMNMVSMPNEYMRGMGHMDPCQKSQQQQIPPMDKQTSATMMGGTQGMGGTAYTPSQYDLAYYQAVAAAAYDSYMTSGQMAAAAASSGAQAPVNYLQSGYYRQPGSGDQSSEHHMASTSSSSAPHALSGDATAPNAGQPNLGYGMFGSNHAGNTPQPSYYYDYNSAVVQDRQAMLAAVANSYPRSYMSPSASLSHYNFLTVASMLNSQFSSQAALSSMAANSVAARATLYPNTTTVSPVIQSSGTTPGATPGKRPRGRPRKHPIAITGHAAHSAGLGSGLHMGAQKTPFDPDRHGIKLDDAQFYGFDGLTPDDGGQFPFDPKRLQAFYSISLLSQVKQLDAQPTSAAHHTEVCEDYFAFGAPFNRLGFAIQAFEDQKSLPTGEDEAQLPNLLTSPPTQTIGDSDTLAERMIGKYNRESCISKPIAVHLNASFVWNGFNPKIPVRDLAVSRHHMAVLLNNSRVLVYRHQTHPLVHSYVDRWDYIEELDHQGIVAIRIVSGCLPLDWRERYHAFQQPKILQRVRRELKQQNRGFTDKSSSHHDDAPADQEASQFKSETNSVAGEDNEPLTEEELNHLILEHPDGVLCSPTLEPNWLPEPFILAAIDQYGLIRLVKCSGYHNYPTCIKITSHPVSMMGSENEATEKPKDGPSGEDPLQPDASAGYFSSGQFADDADASRNPTTASLFGSGMGDSSQHLCPSSTDDPSSVASRTQGVNDVHDPNVKPRDPSGELDAEGQQGPFPKSLPPQIRIEFQHNSLNRVERQLDLTIPTSKIRVQVQDVALGEIIEDSLYFDSQLSSPPEVAMVIYATIPGGLEHSVFIKGRNIYIRFKNFPAGPAKLFCGPLGHTGALLLTNSTVWCWSAQMKNGENHSQSKIGVSIKQVGGSLFNRHVIDLVSLGAECLALTSDGIVHEWNNYYPYIRPSKVPGQPPEVLLPNALTRPMIPEPIELTPTFQKKILDQAKTMFPTYKKGCFSWYMTNDHVGRDEVKPGGVSSEVHPPPHLNDPPVEGDAAGGVKEDVEMNVPETKSCSSQAPITKDPEQEEDKEEKQTSPVLSEIKVESSSHHVKTQVAKAVDEGYIGTSGTSDMDPMMTNDKPMYMSTPLGFMSMEPHFSCGVKHTNSYNLASRCPITSLDMDMDAAALKNPTEASLEWERFSEIQRLYLSEPSNLIERLYLTEGITLFMHTAMGEFRYLINSLGHYHSFPSWSQAHAYPLLNQHGGFTEDHANLLVKLVSQKGKPLITNPVVVARMRLAPQHEVNDNHLRQQLELMATTSTSYRLLLSPTSVIVAFVKQINIVEETKKMLVTFPPVGVAAHHPSLAAQSFTALNPFILTNSRDQLKQLLLYLSAQQIEDPKLPKGPGADRTSEDGLLAHRHMGSETGQLPGSSTAGLYGLQPQQHALRKHRGRVGRPKGSRAIARSMLPQGRRSPSYYKYQDENNDDEEFFVLSSKSRKTTSLYPESLGSSSEASMMFSGAMHQYGPLDPQPSTGGKNDFLWGYILQMLDKHEADKPMAVPASS